MWNENYRWHFDYVRLACDAGFTFSTLKSSVALEKSNIGVLDVEEVIRSRDIGIIERFIPVITQFRLDPEQVQILDVNFIKLFMVAQLAVEYLNFCKMYLDNTVVLLKKELNKTTQDRDSLKSYCEELKGTIAHLKKKPKETEPVVAYKCDNCTKVFSTEEFLLSHIKRRHENQAMQTETDKLQLEIKELKERLNNTEKTTNGDSSSRPKVEYLKDLVGNAGNGTKMNELQQKFEILKAHVESELKLLQTQKSFQDKYERWFEVAFSNLMLPQNPGTPVKTGEVKGTQYDSQEVERRDCGVQTRQVSPTIVTRVHQIHSSPTSRRGSIDFVEVQEKLSAETQERVNKMEENLEKKLTGGMEKIENQMSSFWTKLNEIEQRKLVANEHPKLPIKMEDDLMGNSSEESSPIGPPQMVKPTHLNSVKSSISSLEEDFLKEPPPVLRPPSKESTKTIFVMNPKPPPSTDKEFSEETTDEAASDQAIVVKPSNTSTLARHSITSLKQLVADTKLIKELEVEVEIVLKRHLEEMGVSPQWRGIPKRTFDQTMRVVKHQATLARKNYPQYHTLRKNLIRKLEGELKKAKKPPKKAHPKMSFSGNLKKVNSVPVVDTKTAVFEVSVRGNRGSTYASTHVKEQPPVKPQTSDAFKSVIEELQQVQQVEANKNETKSALKNYPSVGSLTRKKVLFDLESDGGDKGEVQQLPLVKAVESGSTTSVASSVLDGSKVNLNVEGDDSNKPDKKPDKDSDWDISDLLS